MKAEGLVRINHKGFTNPMICEHCAHLLVTDRPAWILFIEDLLHGFGEVVFIAGKFLAMLMIGGLYLFEAVFPHINRIKTDDEIERERRQRDWEDERRARWLEDDEREAEWRLRDMENERRFSGRWDRREVERQEADEQEAQDRSRDLEDERARREERQRREDHARC